MSFYYYQLEKAREAVDAANLRAAYAEVMTAELTGDTTTSRTNGIKVDQTQKKNGWDTSIDWPSDFSDIKAPDGTTESEYWTVKYVPETSSAAAHVEAK